MYTENKRKKRRAIFSPLVLTVDGALGPEALSFLRAIAYRLSLKWLVPFSLVMSWMRQRMALAVIRATKFCIRGSRVQCRGIGVDDDASLMQ